MREILQQMIMLLLPNLKSSLILDNYICNKRRSYVSSFFYTMNISFKNLFVIFYKILFISALPSFLLCAKTIMILIFYHNNFQFQISIASTKLIFSHTLIIGFTIYHLRIIYWLVFIKDAYIFMLSKWLFLRI